MLRRLQTETSSGIGDLAKTSGTLFFSIAYSSGSPSEAFSRVPEVLCNLEKASRRRTAGITMEKNRVPEVLARSV